MPYFILATDAGGEVSTLQALMGSFLPLVAMFAVMYFILIRPQRKKDKDLKKKISELKVGDHVTTIGGLVGRVANIKDDIITIDNSNEKGGANQEKLKIRVQRWAIKDINPQ